MATNTIEAFYLGIFVDIDPNEGNRVTENVGNLVGVSTWRAASPAARQY